VAFTVALASGISVNVADVAISPTIVSLIGSIMVNFLMEGTSLLLLIIQSYLTHPRNGLQQS
jgi:hypothetical protein